MSVTLFCSCVTASPATPARRSAFVLIAGALVAFVSLAAAQSALADCVGLTTLDSAYAQNFDTLANTGTSSTLPSGWSFVETGTAANTTYGVDTGSSTTGNTYSYGASGSTERAFGTLQSGSLISTIGACFINATGGTITSLDIAYAGEEWRLGTAGRADKLTFQFSTDASTLSDGTWTGVSALDFSTPDTASTGAKDGNSSGDRTALSSTITNLSIANGATVWIRWNDVNASGSDDGLAVDDFSATPHGTASTGPTPPVASGTATPSSVATGSTTLLTVHVIPGNNPASTGIVVTADLSAIGGSSTQAFHDDGLNGDATAGDNTYSYNATVAAATSPGSKSLPITVTDDQARTAPAANISLTVFTTLSIMEIQGKGMTSPYAGTVTQPGSTHLGAPITTPKNPADTTHWNIVTAINGTKGFFMQDATGDNDTTTSDGIYVFTGVAPKYGNGTLIAVGDAVQVVGAVQEFDGSTEFGGTLTITKLGTGTVPAPFDLSAHPPTDDNASGICMNAAINPTTDSFQASNFACLDGMLVSFSNATVAAATGGSGGGGNVADAPQYFYATLSPTREFRTPGIEPGDPGYANFGGASLNLPVFSGHPNIFEVYFNSLGVHAADLPNGGIYGVGQQVSVTAGVVQGFQFTDSNSPFPPTSPIFYEIYPLSGASVSVSGTGLSLPTPVADSTPGTLTIGTQNGLHFFNATNDGQDSTAYFDACLATAQQVVGNLPGLNTPLQPGDSDTCPTQAQYDVRKAKMSLQIRTVLKAPMIQVLQEVESLAVLNDIADKIHTDQFSADGSDLTYHTYLFTGNDPQGINIGILAKNGVIVNSVSQLAKDATTNACSGSGSCLLNDRPPVLLDAVYDNVPFRVLAIYDRSLGSMSEKAYVGLKRRAQAEQVAKIVQVLQSDGGTLGTGEACSAQVDMNGTSTGCSITITGSSTIPLVVLGDFNAYEFNDGFVDVVGTIMGTVDSNASHSIYPPTASYVAPNPTMVNPTEPTLDPATHPLDWNPNYSYSFDGVSEELDHILLTRSAWKDFVRISHSHGNADVSSAGPDVSDATTARRLSDHDGQIVILAIDRIFADGSEPQP